MKNRKISEITFQEFVEEAKKRNAAPAATFMLNLLCKEGFSEEQLNKMKMQQVWNLFMTAVDHEFEQISNKIAKTLEKYEGPSIALENFLKEIRKLQKMLEELISDYE